VVSRGLRVVQSGRLTSSSAIFVVGEVKRRIGRSGKLTGRD
jgi:hypothetical protein